MKFNPWIYEAPLGGEPRIGRAIFTRCRLDGKSPDLGSGDRGFETLHRDTENMERINTNVNKSRYTFHVLHNLPNYP